MNLNYFLFLFLATIGTGISYGQYEFSGYVNTTQWEGEVYLSVVEDYRKVSGVYPEQIIHKVYPDSSGYFKFSGNNLPEENRIYRIHVDSCNESDQTANHFNGHCPNSREIFFVANNKDSLQLPFSFDNEMFCKVVSGNEKAKAFLKIDSLKNDMRFAFGTYRSEANRKINTKKWFKTLQHYGELLNEPLAELYIYSYISDRRNELHTYYLQDIKTSSYYNELLGRLKQNYSESPYTKQYEAEIMSDQFLVNAERRSGIPWWVYVVSCVALVSILGNFYFFGKYKKLKNDIPAVQELLSSQEQKVLDLILKDKSNKEIAAAMFVSVSTVKTHINNLYKKLKVSSRAEAKALFEK
ncbi:response regulator transcription factor [Constantimarinum furrinae]|uniref:Regulatory protein n=1 Tax=Constantimarinum furrinae TaxID=2562285 RepID=A0A7G8PUE7_9FLAO|nr:LuxR C-terminal-related transcriptional regulator [Constantimarinum furrinae]QNJ97963.1 regulatory protein [Constantimarinum furrinae]